MKKSQLSAGALGLALVAFVAVNVAAGAGLRRARVDLTAESLYTLSEGSRNIVRSLDESVHLYLYYSEKTAAKAGELKLYGDRVRELLEEYALASGGKVRLQVIDPEPFSEEQDAADRAGITPVRVDRMGETCYLGLLGTGSTDDEEVIPYFDMNSARTLEYDVTRLIWTLGHPEKKVVGLVTSLPLEGAGADMNPFAQQQREPPWQVLQQMRQLFDVRSLGTTFESVPDDVAVLMIVHPKGLGDSTLYAIDQFVLRGGRALVFVDPHCEADIPPTDPNNPMAAMGADRSSNLARLFDAWGLQLVPDKVAADQTLGMSLPTQGGRGEVVKNVVVLALDQDSFDDQDVAVLDLSKVLMIMPGALRKKEGAATELVPLAETTENSMAIDKSRVSFFANAKELLADFVPSGEKQILAARVTGTAASAFPEGKPAASEGADHTGETPGAEHLASSSSPINVIVVADADLLQDRTWVQEQPFFGTTLLQKFAQNGDFAINALDNLSGSDDLISVRGRGEYSRPFTEVERIRAEAEQKWLAKAQGYEQELRDTERQLNELQRERGDDASLILTPEQEERIRQFEVKVIETRKALRDVQYELRKDIEGLGQRLMWLNALAMPLLVSATAVGLLGRRARRRV